VETIRGHNDDSLIVSPPHHHVFGCPNQIKSKDDDPEQASDHVIL